MAFPLDDAIAARPGCVLIVDDEEKVRKPIRLTLTKAGYDVLEAQDGQEAIRLLMAEEHRDRIDAILCDLRMPRTNGHDAIAFIRRECPAIPVIVLTGFPDVEGAIALMRHGVHDYLLKPVTREELLRVIARAIRQHDAARFLADRP
jgi:two-component system chemotaxis response regulator CheY